MSVTLKAAKAATTFLSPFQVQPQTGVVILKVFLSSSCALCEEVMGKMLGITVTSTDSCRQAELPKCAHELTVSDAPEGFSPLLKLRQRGKRDVRTRS
jgi:hypothetical protein